MRKRAILIVDDDPALLKLVRVNLERDYRVLTATGPEQAVRTVAREDPDLVVLDILLDADENGFSVCRQIREFSAVPVIMLTAVAQEEDKLRGFACGADDYMTKPFSAKELLARIEAVLRRAKSDSGPKQPLITVGPLTLDLARRRASINGREVELTPTEYKLLHYLAANRNRVVLHSQLLAHVWGSEYRGEVEYLRVYVSRLRQKIEQDPASPQLLLTHPGIGYLLSGPGADRR